MNSPPYGKSIMIAMSGMGVTFDKQIETEDSLTFYISVPEHSYTVDVHGKEMAGNHLAFRFKETLIALGLKRLTVKAKVRKGEFWTENDRKDAELKCKKMLFGSQY